MKKILIVLLLLVSACAPIDSTVYHVTCYTVNGDVYYDAILHRDTRDGLGVWEDRDGHAVTVPEDCLWVEVSE